MNEISHISRMASSVSLLLLNLFVGCSTPMERREPKPTPRFVADYCIESVTNELSNLPVRLDVSDLPEYCIVDREELMGEDSKEPALEFRKIVQQEFENLIKANFKLAGPNANSKVILTVKPRLSGSLYRDSSGDVKCDVSFCVQLESMTEGKKIPPIKLSQGEIYKKTETYHDIEGYYPCSLYAAIQKAVKPVIDDISRDRDLKDNLREFLDNKDTSLVSYTMDEISDEIGELKYYSGTARFTYCKDSLERAMSYAKGRILSNTSAELQVDKSNCCVFYRSVKPYTEQLTKELVFHFDAAKKTDLILLPSPHDSGKGKVRPGRILIKGDGKTSEQMQQRIKSHLEDRLRELDDNLPDDLSRFRVVFDSDLLQDKDNPEYYGMSYRYIEN